MSEINKDNSLMDTLDNHFLHQIKQMDFCTVGVIKEYDSTKGTGAVQPSPKVAYEVSDEQMEQALIYDVPIMSIGAKGLVLHSDSYVGSDCVILWSTHDLSHFKKGETFNVDEFSMFEYTSCVAVPITSSSNITELEGLSLQSTDGSSYVQLKTNGEVTIKTKSGGTTEYKNDKSVIFQSGAKTDPTGDFITKNGTSLDKHGHIGNLGNPTPNAQTSGLGSTSASKPSGTVASTGITLLQVPDVKTNIIPSVNTHHHLFNNAPTTGPKG